MLIPTSIATFDLNKKVFFKFLHYSYRNYLFPGINSDFIRMKWKHPMCNIYLIISSLKEQMKYMLYIGWYPYHEKNIGSICTGKLSKANNCAWVLQFGCLYCQKCWSSSCPCLTRTTWYTPGQYPHTVQGLAQVVTRQIYSVPIV